VLWLLRFIALRRFRDGKLRTLLTLFGIAAGVTSLIATGAANEAVLKGFRATLDAVGGESDIAVTTALNGELPENLAETVARIPGVQSASPAITEVAKLPDGTRFYVFGVDLAAGDDTRGFNAFGTGGDMPDSLSFLNDPDAVLITRRFAAQRGLKVDDRFPIVTTAGAKSFHVRGLLDEKGSAKAFGGLVAVMDLFTAQAAFGRGKHIDRVDVKVTAGTDVDQVIASVQKAIGNGPQVARPERKGKSGEAMLRSFQVGLFMGSAVSLLVGLFLVFNTVSFAVAQRRREIGTLRAIGVSRAQITGLFALEATVYGALGSLLGLGGGLLLARATVAQALKSLNDAFVSVNVSDASVSPRMMIVGVSMGILGAVAAALAPAMEAARVPPVDALRRDRMSREEKPPTLLGRFLGMGVACLAWPLVQLPLVDGAPIFGNLAIAAIALGAAMSAPSVIDVVHKVCSRPVAALFGAPGRIALAGLIRARRRSGVAAGAVLIGLALVLCLATFVGSFRGALSTWIDRSIPADLFVAQGSTTIGLANTPMEASVGDELLQVPGVADMRRVRLVWTAALGQQLGLYAIDWDNYVRHAHPDITMGDLASIGPKLKRDGMVISDNLRRKTGLRLGDHITLNTIRGPHVFEVAGAIVDYSSDRGIMMLDRPAYMEAFQDTKVDSFDLFLLPGADLTKVRAEIEKRLGGRLELRLSSNAELRRAVFDIIENLFSLVYVLLFIAVVVGVFGVVGTLLAQVLERTRELGILRAMGASRRQVLAAVSIEAGLLGLVGALLGVPAGMVMGTVFVEVVGVQATGWVFPAVYPWAVAGVGALLSIAFAGLGGLLPARRAASLDVVEAIGYE
jgi:putative ABC transport system permease protein